MSRKKDLATLANEYARDTASLVIMYGRRRVGKTALISEFIKDKPALYFGATEESETSNRLNFQELTADFLRDGLLKTAQLEGWEDIFSWIFRQNKSTKRMIIVIDEFQYLGKANAAFPSVFQKIWDAMLQQENVMVVLCGSLISMMVSQILAYDSPLYGRRTAQIRLSPVSFEYYKNFFPKETVRRELVERYSVTGGVPRYIQELQEDGDVYNLIRERILNPNSFLFDEPRFLLQREVENIGSYFSVLRTIAAGHHRLLPIAATLQQKQTSLPRYLNVLSKLDLVEREVPVTEENPEKSKRGLYAIKDNFLSFWFKFVYPNISYIESGHPEIAAKKIREYFIDRHVGFIYERCCQEKLWNLSAEEKIPFAVTRVGRWWNNKETEIDIAAVPPEEKGLVVGGASSGKGLSARIYCGTCRKRRTLSTGTNNRAGLSMFISVSKDLRPSCRKSQRRAKICCCSNKTQTASGKISEVVCVSLGINKLFGKGN